MGLPNIEIKFKALGSTAITRGERGIVALILKDTVPTINPIVMNSAADIPTTGLTDANIAQIQRAWIGYVNPPSKVIAYVLATNASSYSAAQSYLETIKFDYVTVPDIQSSETSAFASWVKACRDDKALKIKAVLPNTTADHEGIINFATDDIVVGDQTYTAAQYCSRIAGLIAGTPLTMSATYATLPEVDDVPHHTKSEFDALIDAGKFVLLNDGEKVKTARAVNSLTTILSGKNSEFTKIKIIDILDQIFTDIMRTANDVYIGKFPNNYDSKILLITAINAYLELAENNGMLDEGSDNSVGIDMEATIAYLVEQGVDTSMMKEQEIKEANTGSRVLLSGHVRPLDALEDIDINFYV